MSPSGLVSPARRANRRAVAKANEPVVESKLRMKLIRADIWSCQGFSSFARWPVLIGEYQNPWGQSSRHRRSNVQTPTPNACSDFRRRTVSPFDPTDFDASLARTSRYPVKGGLSRWMVLLDEWSCSSRGRIRAFVTSTEVSEMAIVTGNRTISTIHWDRTTFRAADSKLHQLERELSALGPTTDLTTTTPILPRQPGSAGCFSYPSAYASSATAQTDGRRASSS